MNAAKWIKIPILLDLCEMQRFLAVLGAFEMFQVGSVVPPGGGLVTSQGFLEDYAQDLERFKHGVTSYARPFGLVWTVTRDAVKRQVLSDGREIIRPILPVIQLQPHHFQFDHATHECRSMVYGTHSVSWGIQFSYPHLFEDPHSHEISTVDETFPNTVLFHTLRLFVREQTRATPLISAGKRVNVPMRLGKQCFSWVSDVPSLAQQGLSVLSEAHRCAHL